MRPRQKSGVRHGKPTFPSSSKVQLKSKHHKINDAPGTFCV